MTVELTKLNELQQKNPALGRGQGEVTGRSLLSLVPYFADSTQGIIDMRL